MPGERILPCLHVGLPRTATTWLQWCLFERHEGIFYLGCSEGPTFRGRGRHSDCRDATVERLVRPLIHDDILRPDLDGSRRAHAESVAPAIARGLVPVLSWESLSLDAARSRQARAENLRAVFGEARILMVLRHPVDFLESSYFQILRRENFHGTYRRIAPERRPLRHFTFGEWIEAEREREVRPHLEYADVVDSYAALFGRDRVHLFLFEDVAADPEGFVRRICAVLGVEAELGVRLTAGRRLNERFTQPQVERLRRLAGRRAVSRWLERAPAVLRMRLLGMNERHPFRAAPPARAEISPRWREWIESSTRAGNRRLEREWGLPLSARGYPT